MNEKLKSLYYCNVENAERKDGIVFGYVDGETDEIGAVEYFKFPVDSARCFYEITKSEGLTIVKYWKFSRCKPLVFDVICLTLISKEIKLIYNCEKVGEGENLFSNKLKPKFELLNRRELKLSQTMMNVFNVGEIINRVKNSERTTEAFTNATRKFIEVALFAPLSGEMSNAEFLEKYDELIFV